MQKRAKIIFTINLILIFTLLSSLPLINAINVRDWNVGDSVFYGIKSEFKAAYEWTNESFIDSYGYTTEHEIKTSISSFDENTTKQDLG